MTIQQLIYVIEIEKNRSFNQAAQVLYISQPTLSKAVSSLEDELGISIFVRSHKGVELTSEGERFLIYAKSIVQQFKEIKRIKFCEKKNPITLHIATIHSTFVNEAFIKICRMYRDQPIQSFSMNNMSTPEVIQNVAAGKSDFGIISLENDHKEFWFNAISSKGMEYQQICTARLSVLISKEDNLAKQDAVTLNDLRDYRYIYFHPPVEEEDESLKYLDQFSLLDRSAYSKAIMTSDRAVAYTLLSEAKTFIFAYNHHKANSNVHQFSCIPLMDPAVEAEIGFIWKAHIPFSSLAKSFIDILRDEMKNGGQDNIKWITDPSG